MKSTITQDLLFYKRYVYPFPVNQILKPYHVDTLVCREGGNFYVVVFVMLFFRIQR